MQGLNANILQVTKILIHKYNKSVKTLTRSPNSNVFYHVTGKQSADLRLMYQLKHTYILQGTTYRVPAKCRERLETSVTLKSLPKTESLVCIYHTPKYPTEVSAMPDSIE